MHALSAHIAKAAFVATKMCTPPGGAVVAKICKNCETSTGFADSPLGLMWELEGHLMPTTTCGNKYRQ
eukprot:scaffold87669_cov60-Phaeocystis_antarctica.AAC.3